MRGYQSQRGPWGGGNRGTPLTPGSEKAPEKLGLEVRSEQGLPERKEGDRATNLEPSSRDPAGGAQTSPCWSLV